MSSKSNIVVGIDIGTSTVSVVVAEPSKDGDLNILGIGQAPSIGLRKGVVINIESTVDSIAKAVAQAEANSGIDISSAYVSIGGGHIKSFNSHGVVGVRGREVTENDIERVVDAARAVAIPNDREILHVLPQEYIIDGQDGIREPLGMSGVRFETRVHIISGAITSAQNLIKCASRCGLHVKDIIFSGLAAAEQVASTEEKDLGVCVVDIGGGVTDIVVFYRGSVRHSGVLSVGGSHLTADIASGLRTPIVAAEDIKIKHGTLLAAHIRSDEIVEVPSTGGRPTRVISKQILAEIIQPRVEEIFSLVQKELVKAGCDQYLTGGIVLTGGGSQLSGISDFAQQIFNLPIRVDRGGEVLGVGTDDSAAFVTALGLLKYGYNADGNPLKSHSRFSTRSRGVWQRFKQKVNEWFSDSDV